MRRRDQRTILHAFFSITSAAGLLLAATVTTYADVVRDEDDAVWLVDHVADGAAMVYHGPVNGEPERLLVTGRPGPFYLEVVGGAVQITPFDESLPVYPETREAVLDLAAALLAASRSEWSEQPPRLLLEASDALADREPVPLKPWPGGLPPRLQGCFGDSKFREDCDNCCEGKWREDRDECRERLDEDNTANLHRCLQYAAISLGTCTARCTFLPTRPREGNP